MPVDPPETCESLRAAIDALNLELLQRLSRRGELVLRLANLAAEGKAPAARDAAREEAMLKALRSHNPGPYRDEELDTIFQAVFQASLNLKRRALAQDVEPDPGLGK